MEVQFGQPMKLVVGFQYEPGSALGSHLPAVVEPEAHVAGARAARQVMLARVTREIEDVGVVMVVPAGRDDQAAMCINLRDKG